MNATLGDAMMTAHEPVTHRVTISDAGHPGRPVVHIDGAMVRGCTRAVLTLDAEGGAPTLELTLMVLRDMDTDLPCRVLLDRDTRKALAVMGWVWCPPPAPVITTTAVNPAVQDVLARHGD
jgi:hypothetical protein